MSARSANRILVVGSEEGGESICSMLAAEGYSCQRVGSGAEAIFALMGDEEFALLLTELVLPNNLPVILVSTVHGIALLARMQEIPTGAYAYDYLPKPIDHGQIDHGQVLNIVRRTLRGVVEERDSLTQLQTQLSRALGEVARAHDSTLEGLGDAMALKSRELLAHSQRVAAYATAIARLAVASHGTPPNGEPVLPFGDGRLTDPIRVIAQAALLHDIGKMAVPDSVLRKPGPLAPEEFAEMQKHCELGYQMVRKIPFLADAAQIAYTHHENWDGEGYPRGLKEEEIPLGARIVSVANTLDTMTSDQPYRTAQPMLVAREEIARWSGRQFDPAIVSVFMSMPDSVWESVRRQVEDAVVIAGSGGRFCGVFDWIVAGTDYLTGLPSRRWFYQNLDYALRKTTATVVVLTGDLDGFKMINADRGMKSADDLLRDVAKAFKARCETSSPRWVPYRMGGDEFAVILTGADLQNAMEFSGKLRADIEKLGVTISIGVAVAPDDGREAEELFVQADRAMYEAKKEGGNRVRRFVPSE